MHTSGLTSRAQGRPFYCGSPAVRLQTAGVLRCLSCGLAITHAIGSLFLLLMPLLARYRREGCGRMHRVMAVFLALFLAAAGSRSTFRAFRMSTKPSMP